MTSVSRGAEQGACRDESRWIEMSLHDPDQFGEVFDRYFAEIHGYAAKRVGRDVADDVAAETFLAAFRSRRRFDPARGTVRAWLYGIATNQLSVYHRREVRAYRALAASVSASAGDLAAEALADQVAARVDAGAARRELAGALAELPSGDREVLLLTALTGLSHAEVAAALGIPYGTVGSRLNRVRGKLRTLASVAAQIDREA